MEITALRSEAGFEIRGCRVSSLGATWRVDFRLNEVVVVLEGHDDVVLLRKPSPSASGLFQALRKGQGRDVERALFGVARDVEATLLARQED